MRPRVSVRSHHIYYYYAGCMNKKHSVFLSDEQRLQLIDLVKKGKAGGREIRRAHTLLMANSGSTDEAIASFLHISIPTVERAFRFC